MEIHRDTVSDVIEDLARHAREVTDYLITNVGLTQIQVDEMWSFVKKVSASRNARRCWTIIRISTSATPILSESIQH